MALERARRLNKTATGPGRAVGQNVALAQAQEVVQFGNPVPHVHGAVGAGLKFGEVQIGRNDQVQRLDLFLAEVVLGDGDVGLADGTLRRVLPGRQAHVRPGGVGALPDDFGRCVTVGGPVHLILDGLEEPLGHLGARVVIDARGVDVDDLLVEQPLARADVADAGQRLVEVVLADGAPGLDALIVEHEPLDEQFPQLGRGPLPELRSARRAHAVAHGEDHVEAVMERAVMLAVGRSCQVFLDN